MYEKEVTVNFEVGISVMVNIDNATRTDIKDVAYEKALDVLEKIIGNGEIFDFLQASGYFDENGEI